MIDLPYFEQGQRIGLFGGSFNPAHRGHYAVALYALKRLQLDWVWWLVSPQNPLKSSAETAAYDERLRQTADLAEHPRFRVTDLEGQIGSRNTAGTLAGLAPALARGKFVWIMGADSFKDLHRWHDWTRIVDTLPLAVLARPGYSIRALGSPAALRYDWCRVPNEQAALLPGRRAPAWVFIPMPLRKESSTAIRALNRQSRGLKQKRQTIRR